MADKANYTKQFASECNDFDDPVDTHEEAAEGQQPASPRGLTGPPRVNHAERQPTAVHIPGPVETAREDTRVLTPGQPPPPAANHRQSRNGEAPASPELTCSLVDTESPASVRDNPSPDSVTKRPPSPAHGTSGHTSQADDDTSSKLPLTSSETDVEHPDDNLEHSNSDLEHPDDLEHDGPRKRKKGHELMSKRPRVERGAQADT